MTDFCSVCGSQDNLSLVASGIAPISFSACNECRARGAENIGVVSLWLAAIGGPDNAPNVRTDLVSYIDGGYVDWTEIRAHFLQNEEDIRRAFTKEFGIGGKA